MKQSSNREGKELQQQKKKRVPVKKDMRFVNKITPKKEYHTVESIQVPSTEGGSYSPLWMCNIPTTLEDFQKKEKSWKGFKRALKAIGLDIGGPKKADQKVDSMGRRRTTEDQLSKAMGEV